MRMRLCVVLGVLALLTSYGAAYAADVESDDAAAGAATMKWGVLDGLCCYYGGYHTFWVKMDNVKMSSTNRSCSRKSSWSGYHSATAGKKGGRWGVTAYCAKYGGSFSAKGMSAGKCYFFYLTMSGSTRIIRLYQVVNCGKPSAGPMQGVPEGAELVWEQPLDTEAQGVSLEE